MEQREQCTLNPGLRQAQAHSIQAEETCPVQDSPLQTTEVSKSRKTQRTLPCHGAVGARPYCSPEYSPDFYKLDSTLPHSKFGRLHWDLHWVQRGDCRDTLPRVITDADTEQEDTFVLCLLQAHVAQKPTQGSSLL
ncbi:uncharacterized protein LOC121882680 isoform X5 [Thunnus maccoyii]|uniref:uncharacterized protein LOC121882680 isoform X5 n=1 Tax=Thunnus maccoyii TaxID=8240 RepID=UPI001C4BD5C1|nr:uncharacterized protein LOC121882680 isoform X5 [Thunnus maccoyii]